MRSLVVAALLLQSSAYASAQARWTLAAKPLLEIGVVEGDPEQELFDARSSVRLTDGRIVVLNAGSNELRFYDKSGKFLSKTGRKGKGPGEFGWAARVYYTHPDSLLVFDQSTSQESHFDATGKFIGLTNGAPVAGEVFKRDAWFYGRYFIDGPAIAANRGRLKPALAALPKLAPGEIRFVKVDPWNRLWVRESDARSNQNQQWSVYDAAGKRIATIETPAHFEIHQIGPDFLLGRYRKELDVEFIRLYELRAEIVNRAYVTPAAARTYTPPVAQAVPQEILSPLRAYLRNAAGQQEMFYSRNSTYADDIRKLGIAEDKNIVVHILSASERGWAMIAVPRDADVICGMSMGTVPLGWAVGQAICGDVTGLR
jgi:hypothetical protein